MDAYPIIFQIVGTSNPLATMFCPRPVSHLQNRFNPNGRDGYFGILRGDTILWVSDITTLVSAALFAIRLAGQGIVGTVVWRCAMILLQQDGLNLYH